jgi:hypothetical protein
MPPYYPDDRVRRESPNDIPPYVNDQLRRDAEAQAFYHRQRADRDRPATRPRINSYNTSPASARSPLSARDQPVVHQYPSARHSGTIPQRGADVIARAQARGPTGSGNMNDAFANMDLGDDEELEPSGGQYYSDQRRKRRYQWYGC